MIRKRVIVRGLVQGVGFRWAARDQARMLDVCGWVRNRPDGCVEAEIEGDEASVDDMLGWLGRGPAEAQVSSLEVDDATPVGSPDFTIVR